MSVETEYPTAPPLQVSRWFNSAAPITLAGLRGKVVIIEVFQMLCPACVVHGLPQAAAIADTFAARDVTALGLHSVFEHHDAMPPHALEAFLHEYGIRFPVAVDAPAGEGADPIPKTMRAYGLRGTPSLLAIDRAGRLRINRFGHLSDMRVAAEISKLVFERDEAAPGAKGESCTPEGCTV